MDKMKLSKYTTEKLEEVRKELDGKFAINYIVQAWGDYYCFRWDDNDPEESCRICGEHFPKIKSAKGGYAACGWKCPYFNYSSNYIIKKITFILNNLVEKKEA